MRKTTKKRLACLITISLLSTGLGTWSGNREAQAGWKIPWIITNENMVSLAGNYSYLLSVPKGVNESENTDTSQPSPTASENTDTTPPSPTASENTDTTPPSPTASDNTDASQAPPTASETPDTDDTKSPEPDIEEPEKPQESIIPLPRPTPVPTNPPASNVPIVTVPTVSPVQTPETSNEPDASEAPEASAEPISSEIPEASEEPISSMPPEQTPGGEENQVPAAGNIFVIGGITYRLNENEELIIEKIEDNAVKKVMTIPNTVEIGEKSYPVVEISDGVFKNNTTVQEMTLGNRIVTVGKNAFHGCKKLRKVKSSNTIRTIKSNGFSGCTALKEITLPSTVTKIGNKAFKNCSALKKFKIGNAAAKGGAVSGASVNKALKMSAVAMELVAADHGPYLKQSSSFAGKPQTLTIGDYAFAACSSMKKVIINSGVRIIGSSAFKGCKKLSNITIKSKVLETVRKMALKGVNNCIIAVPPKKVKPYRTLFRNKGQGKKVLVAKV